MNRTALTTLFSLSALLIAPLASAQQCPPGSIFCAGAGAGIGGGYIGGGISIGGAPAQVVVPVQPPPPPLPPTVVYVQEPAPPPEVVYVQTAPPPPVYYTPPPQQVIVTQAPTYVADTTPSVQYLGMGRGRSFGLGAFASALTFGGHDAGARVMGGVGAAMRFRTSPYFATEVTIAGMLGNDYNGDTRQEIPVTVSEMLYFNPQNRFQFYGLVGIGGSFARVGYTDDHAASRGRDSAGYTYFGGQIGLGAEWQLSPRFSIFGDARAFLRTRVDSETQSNPEFTRTVDGRTQTTNLSTGVAGQVGGIFYF